MSSRFFILSTIFFSCITCQIYADNTHSYVTSNITNTLNKIIPELKIDSIVPGPAGLYQVTSGNEVFFVTKDGKYLLHGALLDLSKDKENWNLTEQARKKIVKAIMDKVALKDMVIFNPKNPIGYVNVFTDVDCGYCRKFHANIDEIMAKGIEVRYLAFPRSGKDSPTYNKTVSIWCSDSPTKDLTKAKKGEEIPEKTCNNPIETQIEIGKNLGIMGTPTLIFADGTMIASYLPADNLLEQVKKHSLINTYKGK
jgi:thiol:disulfide interchange protein DsbC